jgi:hypothetical protein
MTAFFNPFRKGLLPVLLIILLSSLTLVSCDQDQLEIQNDFPFELQVMPVPKDIANGETVEIRITLKRSGNYSDTKYFIRYFQFDGKGILKYNDAPPYLPNDLYSLPKDQFRLYYTSRSTVSQSFDVWISDNFGNEKQLSFQFNNSD